MNRRPRLYSFLFLLPLAGYWISFLVGEPVPAVFGNRPLAPWPPVEHTLPTSAWLQKAAAWATERSPFRYHTIRLRNKAQLFAAKELFPIPVNPGHADICFGKDGWLFLLNETSSHRSKDDLHRLTKLSLRLARMTQESGRKFYFVIFPDKMSVYPEYSGWTKKWAERHANRPMLADIMKRDWAKAEDVHQCYIPILPAFLQAKAQKKEPLFWRTDTHWDDAGIVAATRAMVNGIQPGLFEESSVVSGGFGGSHDTGGGNDLVNEFLAQNEVPYGPIYSIHRAQELPPFERRAVVDPAYGGLLIYHNKSPLKNVIKGRTLLIGDSFGMFAFPMFAPWFEDLTFIHHGALGTPELAECLKNSDTIIWSTVERGLEERLQYWNGFFRSYFKKAIGLADIPETNGLKPKPKDP